MTEKHAALGVHMVGFAAGVVLGDEDCHLLPVPGVGEELDNAPKREVVVGHPGGDVGVAFVGLGVGAVVVAHGDVEEGGEGVEIRAGKRRLDVLHEPVSAVLVGDVHVENGEAEAGVVVEDLGHGDVDDLAGARGALVRLFFDAGQLEALAVIAEPDAVPGEVVPHGARLGIVLRYQRPVRAHRVTAARGGAVLLERPSRRCNSSA